ncbi:hypothetical protein HK098_003033 [Nowakowskiella sp. JEL0407]|nr:hypothetical protein HK098_003033 [Nowakowskiella sp. JEL0407]
MISDPSLMRGALRSPTIVRTPILQECYEGLSSFILFTLPTDDIWKKHRKGLQPAFGPTHLREAFGVSIEVINSLMSVWKDMYKSGVKKRNLTHDFEMLTGDIIAEVAFSVDLGCVQSLRKNDHKKPEIFHMLEKIDGAMVARTGFTKLRGLWPLLGISVEQIAPYVEKAKKIFTDIIEAKKSKLAIPVTVDGKESNLALGADLLERLLSERSDSLPWFSDEEVFGEVYGFFAAGHDTTATTLTWSMYELCKNTSVMEKLREEVDSFNEELTTESLNSLKYLEATIKEILRIHAPVFSLTRIATDDTELKVSNGETLLVAKNEVLHLNLHTIHTSKKYWGNDAEEFNPDRWLKSGFSPEAYFPFG